MSLLSNRLFCNILSNSFLELNSLAGRSGWRPSMGMTAWVARTSWCLARMTRKFSRDEVRAKEAGRNVEPGQNRFVSV